MTNFELLAQSWVLRVGHYPLKTDHESFLTAINSITDWTKVHCDSGDLLINNIRLESELLGTVECDILDTVYSDSLPVCDDPSCSVEEAWGCCLVDVPAKSVRECCSIRYSFLTPTCEIPGCSKKTECCVFNRGNACCSALVVGGR